jgi:hypothetical protein
MDSVGGFNFIYFFGISKIDRYCQKNNFLLFAKCLKMYSFFAFAFKVCKKCYYDPKYFFLEKYQYGYQKDVEFYADFKFVDAGFQKCP